MAAKRTAEGLKAGEVYTATHKGEEFEARVLEVGGALVVRIGNEQFKTLAAAAADIRGYSKGGEFWHRTEAAPKPERKARTPREPRAGGEATERKAREPRPIAGLVDGARYTATFKKAEYAARVVGDLGEVEVTDATGNVLGQVRGLQKAGAVITGYEVAGNTWWHPVGTEAAAPAAAE